MMTQVAEGILLVGAGLGVMALGLYLFYVFLPLLYGLLGAGLGYGLGLAIMGRTVLEGGWLELGLAIGLGIAFALAAYFIEPIRRGLLGVLVGGQLGLAIGYAIGVGTLLHLILAVAGAVAGVLLALVVFDHLIVIASSFAGAAMLMDGAHLLLPRILVLDRGRAFARQGWAPLLIWVALAAAGLAWQYSNLNKWPRETEADSL